MTATAVTQVAELNAHLEEMWGHLDTLFASLEAGGGWEQKHGADWTFADVPYHLAYCNQDLVARGLQLGADYPESEQELLASPQALGVWNDRKFAERPAGQTAAESVAQWRESTTAIRSQTASMQDADLERRCWFPLFLGWGTARDLLMFVVGHDWSEFMQLRIHMGLTEPTPSAAITRHYLGRLLGFFPMFLNKEAAGARSFAVVMAFSDPDVGAWTIRVADGEASVSYGASEDADLVLTQSAETFEKTFQGIQEPVAAIEAGELQVSDFEKLALFGQLFPM